MEIKLQFLPSCWNWYLVGLSLILVWGYRVITFVRLWTDWNNSLIKSAAQQISLLVVKCVDITLNCRFNGHFAHKHELVTELSSLLSVSLRLQVRAGHNEFFFFQLLDWLGRPDMSASWWFQFDLGRPHKSAVSGRKKRTAAIELKKCEKKNPVFHNCKLYRSWAMAVASSQVTPISVVTVT